MRGILTNFDIACSGNCENSSCLSAGLRGKKTNIFSAHGVDEYAIFQLGHLCAILEIAEFERVVTANNSPTVRAIN